MGVNLCKSFDFRLNETTGTRFIRDRNHFDKSNNKNQLPPLFIKSNKIASLNNSSKLNHTKSDISDANKEEFKEELNCSVCSSRGMRKVDEKSKDIEISKTPVAWTEQWLNDDNYLQPSDASRQRLSRIGSEDPDANDGIGCNKTTDRIEDEFEFENESVALTKRSMTPIGKQNDSSQESIFGSSEENGKTFTDNHFSHRVSELETDLKTEIHYTMNQMETLELANYVKNFSANLMISSDEYWRRDQFRGRGECWKRSKEKCGFCDFVANKCDGRWNELDNDVTKLMETVDKLSSLLAEKELSLSQDFVHDKELNEKKLKERVIQLRNKKRIGISLHKTSLGKRLIIFKDGKNTYQIEVSNPSENKSKNEELNDANNLPETQEVIAQTYEPNAFGGTLEKKYQISTNRQISTKSDIRLESLPQSVDTLEVCDKAAARLRELAQHLDHGEIPNSVLQKTLLYAAYVLDTVSMDETRKRPVSVSGSSSTRKPGPIRAPSEPSTTSMREKPIEIQSAKTTPVKPLSSSKQWTRRLLDEEDELSEVQPDSVPNEVREWLASTFTRSNNAQKRRPEDKPKFRSVANAIRAGIMVDRIYRRLYSSTTLHIPSEVATLLKGVDEWSFDVFALNETCNGQVLKFLSSDLLNRYGLIHKFKIPSSNLENFLLQIEQGYVKYSNPYHNNLHAADVTQTVHYTLWVAGLAQWLSDLEIFATLIAAIIHDFQHTGTTNNFHVMSGSDITLIYNDRSVLENFHISAAFKVMKEEESNILANLSKEEYREFRTLVIDMVLATDMSSHFQQIKTLKTLLGHTEFTIDKSKGLSYILHCSDISHPSKNFRLHHKWTKLLMEEFFRQGDMEKELGLPYSPLCDRNTTLIPQSQIGFIDFIVGPTMELCGDLIDKIQIHIHGSQPVQEVSDKNDSDVIDSKSRAKSLSAMRSSQRNMSADSETDKSNIRSSASAPLASRSSATVVKVSKMKRPWLQCLEDNKINWQERAAEEAMSGNSERSKGNGDTTPESEL